MPDFENNPLIKEIDAKRKAAEEARAAEPKIISIKTRSAWVPEKVEKKKRVRRPKVDQEAVEMVERILARLKAGEVEGALVIVSCKGEREGFFDLALRTPAGKRVEQEALRWIGAMELMRGDLVELAEYGEPTDDEVIILDDGDDDPELGA
ncbi:hypothetical protein [Methylobacterium sp. AMS5]|uniref:hypothetical protein n=1 Tax=Methylobacterium sp. AMS5 TaxID=925818 RepID=UPI00074F845E|nr:hypothetical protein [Methylobacterium sp. AMS5]AMB48282.1 hypothetical protein Y590_25275 [Methylobacterium sp. AMS5]